MLRVAATPQPHHHHQQQRHQDHATAFDEHPLCMPGNLERSSNSYINNMGLNLSEDNSHRINSTTTIGSSNNGSSTNNAALRSFLMLEDQQQQQQQVAAGISLKQTDRRRTSNNTGNMSGDNPKSSKRSKVAASDYQGAPQMGLAQLPSNNGQQGNLFQSELQRAHMYGNQHQQHHTQGGMMNNSGGVGSGFGSISASHMERRLEEEMARQQQSAMLANEMAMATRMNHQMMGAGGGGGAMMNSNNNVNSNGNGGNGNNFGNGNMNDPSGFVNGQRQQGLYDNNVDFLNNASAMQDLQNMQNFQLSTMAGGAQPLLTGMGGMSGMLDFSLLNNRFSNQQGFGGGSNAGSSSMNHNQMLAMSQQGNHQMGHLQGNGNNNNSNSHQVNPMSALSSGDALQMSRMNTSSSSGPAPQESFSMDFSGMGGNTSPGTGGGQSNHYSQQLVVSQMDGAGFTTLPPMEEAQTPHYNARPFIAFSIEEDANWLSSFQCFIRSEILELFRVSSQGIKVRNALKSLTVNQVGIRCRFCAHLQHGTRANRASCFPSKIDKIYQSFTMMLREHFPSCSEIPEATKKRFTQLQNMNAQGASNAKGYWEHAAKKKGLVDISEDNGRGGIHIFESTMANAASLPPFGSTPTFKEPQPPQVLVYKIDQNLVSEFLYALMEQTYRVHLAPSERKGNRKSLRPGMPGFGCRYCYDAGRMGLSRLFPARRRTIHTKVPDLFDHLRRCPLCPQQMRNKLITLHAKENGGMNGIEQNTESRGREREFFERIWTRLGHQDDAE